MDWDKLRIFHIVATAGSFTTAGQMLGCSQSAVSRQIRTLEDSLKAALFTRHARGLVLTQEGKDLFNLARSIVHQIEETERSILESRTKTTGVLRVTTMVTFGAVWLTPHLNEFMTAYPELDIQLLLDDNDLDLSTGQADVGIRLHEPEKNDMIARPLVTFHAHIYASPAYLERKGTPTSATDLRHHDLISFTTSNAPISRELDWLPKLARSTTSGTTSGGPHQTPRLKVNNLYGVLHAVEAGMGIAVLPDYLVHNKTNLVRILPQVDGASFNSYFCYAPELRGSKRVSLFYDFLLRQIRSESNIL